MGIAYGFADLLLQLICDALCHGTGRKTAGLGMPNKPANASR